MYHRARKRPCVALFCSLCLLELCRLCWARVTTVAIDQSGPGITVLLQSFGVATGARLEFEADYDLAESSGGARGYIVVVEVGTAQLWYARLLELGLAFDGNPPAICAAPAEGRFEVGPGAPPGPHELTVPRHMRLDAYMLTCCPSGGGGSSGDDKAAAAGVPRLAARVTTTAVNLSPEGRLSQHLSVERAMLPSVFALEAVAFSLLAVAWSAELVRLRAYAAPVHFLCLGAVWLKALASALLSWYWSWQSRDGQGHMDTFRASLCVEALAEVTFLGTLLLLSVGWGVLRRGLGAREWATLGASMAVYGGVAVAEALVAADDRSPDAGVGGNGGGSAGAGDDGAGGNFTFFQYVLRSLVMLSIVVAINLNVARIRFGMQTPWTSSTALEYHKLSQYHAFRLTFLIYLLLPTSLQIIESTVTFWEYAWLQEVLEGFCELCVYAHLGTIFAPMNGWLLTRAFDRSLER